MITIKKYIILMIFLCAQTASAEDSLAGKYVGMIKTPWGWSNYKCYVTLSSNDGINYRVNLSYGIKNISLSLGQELADTLKNSLEILKKEKIRATNGARFDSSTGYQRASFSTEKGHLTTVFMHNEYLLFSRKSITCGQLTRLK